LATRASIDLTNTKRFEVLAGLLSRNAQWMMDMACDMGMLISPHYQIVIRCMVETLLRIKWYALKASDEDFVRFQQFGLGQEKLFVEHLKTEESRGLWNQEALEREIEVREGWINSQRLTSFLDVDLGGGPEGKDLRRLAEDIDVLRLHRLFFSPLSSAVHGHWNTIASVNMIPCANELHGLHYLPAVGPGYPRIDALIHAVDIYESSYTEVCSALTGEPEESVAARGFQERLAQLSEGYKDADK